MKARICCAYLRVYRPLEGLSPAERTVATGGGAGPAQMGLGLLAPEECQEVYEKVVDGVTYYCPTNTRLRKLLGFASFERAVPATIVGQFFTPGEMALARRGLREIERAQAKPRPPMVQSTWHVPPRWFVCFDDVERRFEQTGDHPTIRYQTWLSEARDRVGRALDLLTGGIVHPVIIGMIYELKEWLAGFEPEALLELDYASVATLFDPDELADDRSAADVWGAIDALSRGDGAGAMADYRRVNERWAQARLRESLS
jgi:hypothetical protein